MAPAAERLDSGGPEPAGRPRASAARCACRVRIPSCPSPPIGCDKCKLRSYAEQVREIYGEQAYEEPEAGLGEGKPASGALAVPVAR